MRVRVPSGANILCPTKLGVKAMEENGNEQDGNLVNFSDFGWNSECVDHLLCNELKAASLDPVLSTQSELGQTKITNPLKALMLMFVLKDGTAKTTAAAQQLAKLVIEAGNNYELCIYSGGRNDFIATGSFPNDDDIEGALSCWIRHCHVARQIITKSGFGPINMSLPIGVNGLPEAEQEGWKSALANSSWILELVRAKEIHRKTTIVTSPRVFIGDSSANAVMKGLEGSEWVGQEGSINLTIRQMSTTILTSRVKAALVMIGRDALTSGETVTVIGEQMERLFSLCQEFKSVKIIWAPPPFVNEKKTEHGEVVRMLQLMLMHTNVTFACTTEDGRSLLEVWRYADRHNKYALSETGELTKMGIQMTKGWVFSQTTGLGDEELGIPARNRVGSNRAGAPQQQQITAGNRAGTQSLSQPRRLPHFQFRPRSRSPLRRPMNERVTRVEPRNRDRLPSSNSRPSRSHRP